MGQAIAKKETSKSCSTRQPSGEIAEYLEETELLMALLEEKEYQFTKAISLNIARELKNAVTAVRKHYKPEKEEEAKRWLVEQYVRQMKTLDRVRFSEMFNPELEELFQDGEEVDA